MTQPILIVGAGPTGLNLALQLARRGIDFRIIDARPGPGEASRALGIHARTLEFYAQLGFAEAVVAAGIKAEAIHLRENGEDVALLRLGDMGGDISPYPFLLTWPQDEHERFLLARLADAGIAVDWQVRLNALVQDADGATAELAAWNARETARFAWIAGCDGASSVVRHQLGIGFAGGTYDQPFYVADVTLAGDFGHDLVMNLGAGSFVLVLPVRSSGHHRLIGVIPAGGMDADFETLRAPIEGLLGTAVSAVHWFSTYRVHHRVAAHFRVGRCFLAGDAGHIHSPAGGQGMNTGIGDAVNLGWKLAAVAAGRAPPGLLDSYEPERIAFARSLVATTDRAFEALIGPGLGGKLVRTVLIPNVMPMLLGFSAVRRALFQTVSQVRLHYPDSPLSAGAAGDVAGGDRLPWAVCDGADNFAPLRSLAWQLHVYGAPDPDLVAAAAALGLPLHRFAWCAAARHAGLAEAAAYLVRPDGYVALAQARQDSAALAAFAQGLGIDMAG